MEFVFIIVAWRMNTATSCGDYTPLQTVNLISGSSLSETLIQFIYVGMTKYVVPGGLRRMTNLRDR